MIPSLEGERVIVVSSSKMDTRLPESMQEVTFGVQALKHLDALGLNMRNILLSAEHGEYKAVDNLHAMSALLHSDWQHADTSEEEDHAVAVAKLFNRATEAARRIQTSLHPFNEKPLMDLATYIEEDVERERVKGEFDIDGMASAVYFTARQRNHWDSWAYRVLPSRRGQPYTSMGLFSVSGETAELPPIHVTQMSARRAKMFSHVHGLSGAFAAPYGDPNALSNTHENIIWGLHSDEQAFPLKPIKVDSYDTKNVVFIPPRWIHSVVIGGNIQSPNYPSLAQLAEDKQLATRIIEGANFGLLTDLHVYRPMRDIVDNFGTFPYEGAWEQAGMLAFNHITNEIFLGSLHAMELRMASWKDGKCCGACLPRYVEDDRRETVSLKEVKNLIEIPKPEDSLPIWRL